MFGGVFTPFAPPNNSIIEDVIMSDSDAELKITSQDRCKDCAYFDSYRSQGRTASHWYCWGWCHKYFQSVFEDAICKES